MNASHMTEVLKARFPNPITCIDSHTAGEPTRLIVDGVGPLPGATMEAKRQFFMTRYDSVRKQLTREPRGHRDMLAAVLCEPVTEGAQFGLIYMDARRYPYLCGHATIGAVTTLLEAGALPIQGSESVVVVDTPSGPMESRAFFEGGRVQSVAIEAVPSFVHRLDEPLDVPGLGNIQVATVCVGGFFAMVAAEQISIDLVPGNSARLIDLGMKIIDAANRQLEVRHPTRPAVHSIDVTEFYEISKHDRQRGTGIVVYGESHMDRSPCGTGTAAKLTLLHRLGLLDIGEPFYNSGPLKTTFEARLLREAKVGDVEAVVVEIRGSAHITGVHQFVHDPRDPFPGGFLL